MASRFSFSSGVNGRLSGVKLMPGISGDWEGDSVGDWAEAVPMNRALTAAAGINLHAMFQASAIPPICIRSRETTRAESAHGLHTMRGDRCRRAPELAGMRAGQSVRSTANVCPGVIEGESAPGA
jgi:hypothetical protein